MSQPDEADSNEFLVPQPLPYHHAIRDHFKHSEPKMWEWFSQTKTQSNHAENVKFDLLKSTYRIDRETNESLYRIADEILMTLGIEVPITFYQAQRSDGLNASICAMIDEAHIIFRGPVLKRLDESELKALIAHELGHLILWREWERDFLITEMILTAQSNDPRVQPPHLETARLFQLHTEVYCDRVSMNVAKEPGVVIATLVKMVTGVDDVHAESYLKQAKEIETRGELGSEGITHPELYIRALAVDRWDSAKEEEQKSVASKRIETYLIGNLTITFDLLGQQKVADWTRQLIELLLAPDWMKTDLNLAHAKAFFEDFEAPNSEPAESELFEALGKIDDDQLRQYFVYVLLDFSAADRDLEFAPIALALGIAINCGWQETYASAVRKEMRLRKKQMTEIEKTRKQIIEDAVSKAKA